MKEPEQFYAIRLPDEIKTAILSGTGYKGVKLNNVTLNNLKQVYQNRLDNCEDDLERYYEHGIITLDVDDLLHFRTSGIDVTVPRKLNITRDNLVDALLAVLAVYDRNGCKDLIAALQKKIDDNIRRLSVDGISDIAEKVLEDARQTTRVLDGVQLNEEGNVNLDDPPLEDDL